MITEEKGPVREMRKYSFPKTGHFMRAGPPGLFGLHNPPQRPSAERPTPCSPGSTYRGGILLPQGDSRKETFDNRACVSLSSLSLQAPVVCFHSRFRPAGGESSFRRENFGRITWDSLDLKAPIGPPPFPHGAEGSPRTSCTGSAVRSWGSMRHREDGPAYGSFLRP
jgi:hypothetical protein